MTASRQKGGTYPYGLTYIIHPPTSLDESVSETFTYFFSVRLLVGTHTGT